MSAIDECLSTSDDDYVNPMWKELRAEARTELAQLREDARLGRLLRRYSETLPHANQDEWYSKKRWVWKVFWPEPCAINRKQGFNTMIECLTDHLKAQVEEEGWEG